MSGDADVISWIKIIPGLTALDVYDLLMERWHQESWLGRHLAKRGVLSVFLGPWSYMKVFLILDRYEKAGIIRAEWTEPSPLTGYRRRKYYPAFSARQRA